MRSCNNKFEAQTFGLKNNNHSEHAVVSWGNRLCCFGSQGSDICLANRCNENRDSWIDYDRTNGTIFDTKSKHRLNGGAKHFKVKQIEVFECE